MKKIYRVTTYLNIETVLKLLLIILLFTISIRYFQSRLYLSDLKVYYGASHKLFSSLHTNIGENNPYHYYYGLVSGYYKYAPFFLILFSVIAAIPWSVLIILYPILNLFGLYVLYKGMKNLLSDKLNVSTTKEKQYLNNAFILGVILQSHNIYREVLIGNINIFLMILLLYFLIFNLDKKILSSSLCLSLLVLIKPHFIFILLLLFFYKKFKTILYTTLISILLLLSTVPFFGVGNSLELMYGWFTAMLMHNSANAYIENPLNLQFVLWKLGFLFKLNSHLFVNIIIVFVPFITFLFLFLKRKKYLFEDKYFIIFTFFLSAIIPFILLVDTNQLLYIFPFSVYLFYKALPNIKNTYFLWALFFCVYVFTLLTQQIPRDWMPIDKFIGGAYLLLLFISYRIKILAAFDKSY